MSTLTDALLGMLGLAFVCVRLNDPEGGPSIETMRIGEMSGGTARSDVSFASARLGLHGELGIVVAGSWRLDFPADTERLLLDVAANQAAIGLQQARLLQQAPRLRSEQKGIMDTIPGLVAMLTPAGEVDVVNHELVEYCGQGLEAMKQWGTNGTVHADDLPRVGPVFARAIASGTPYNFEARVRRFDGVYRWCQIRGLPHRDTSEHIARWYVLLTDIDDRKRAEEALNRARSELAHVSRVTTVSALTASIAHEVNQPLSGIITNAGTCLRMLDADPPDIDGARETARRTIRDGNRASDVITRLRALFSKKEFTLESLDLNEATREVIALSSSDLQRNRVDPAVGARRRSADRHRRSHPAPASHPEPAPQRLGRDGRRARSTATVADQNRTGGRRPCASDGPRCRRRPPAAEPGLAVRCVLHDEERRHGHRVVCQPLNRRETSRSSVGRNRTTGPGATFSFSIPRSSSA